jgi:hypothetical protein
MVLSYILGVRVYMIYVKFESGPISPLEPSNCLLAVYSYWHIHNIEPRRGVGVSWCVLE